MCARSIAPSRRTETIAGAYAEDLLQQMELNEQYLGFTLVAIANDSGATGGRHPLQSPMLLLPHCLKNAEGCPADYDEFGLDCKKCGACSVADFKVKAEELGYKVLVSEGTPIVLKIIVCGHVDAIVGVACLNVLEKAFDKILLAGIPCVATPLLSSNCKSTSVDDDWVFKTDRVENRTDRTAHEKLRASDARCQPDLRVARAGTARPALPNAGSQTCERWFIEHRSVSAPRIIAYDFLARAASVPGL